MLWTFVEGCISFQLKFDECGSVFSLAVIGVLLIAAVCALVVLLLKRKSAGASP